MQVFSPEWSYDYDGCGRFCLHLRAAIWMDEELYAHPDAQGDEEVYAPDSGWFVKKTPSYGFAAKGGCYAELHNHNDVGTFIFAKNGRQMLTDLGPGTYTRQYFGPERYSILQCASRGHSVPLIGGREQFPGEAAATRGTTYADGVFHTEISGAYAAPGLSKLLRSFSFGADAVTLTDEIRYTGKGGITERFVSLVKPTVGDGEVMADEARIGFDAARVTPVIRSERTEEGGDVWFVDFDLPADTERFRVVIR